MTDGRSKRRAAHARGLDAEARAANGYAAAGFTIEGTRVRTALGEIDLIASRSGLLVFVEVKQRKTLAAAAEAVRPGQQKRIVAAAEIWLAENPTFASYDVRFDVVLLAPGAPARHIVDAFRPTHPAQ